MSGDESNGAASHKRGSMMLRGDTEERDEDNPEQFENKKQLKETMEQGMQLLVVTPVFLLLSLSVFVFQICIKA